MCSELPTGPGESHKGAPDASPEEGVESCLVPASFGHPSSSMFLGQGELWGGPHPRARVSPSWGYSHPASVSPAVGSLLQRGSPPSVLGSPHPWGLLDWVCSPSLLLKGERVWILPEASPGFRGRSDLAWEEDSANNSRVITITNNRSCKSSRAGYGPGPVRNTSFSPISISIFQRGKLRPREAKTLAQGHTAGIRGLTAPMRRADEAGNGVLSSLSWGWGRGRGQGSGEMEALGGAPPPLTVAPT